MNRIVRERYPVAQLPEDLRVGLENYEVVNIVLQLSDQPVAPTGCETQTTSHRKDAAENVGGQFSRFKHLRRANYSSADEVNDYISGLRDEWAHRER